MATAQILYDFSTSNFNPTTTPEGFSSSTLSGLNLVEFTLTTGFGYLPEEVPLGILRTASTTALDARTNNRYFTFTVTPANSSQPWTPQTLAYKAARGGSSTPRGWLIRTSNDNYSLDHPGAGDITSVRPTLSQYTTDLSAIGTITGPLTFRVFPYAPATTSSIEFDDLLLTFDAQDTTSINSWTERAATRIVSQAGVTLTQTGGPTAASILESPSGTFYVTHPASPHADMTFNLVSANGLDTDEITLKDVTAVSTGGGNEPGGGSPYFVRVNDGSISTRIVHFDTTSTKTAIDAASTLAGVQDALNNNGLPAHLGGTTFSVKTVDGAGPSTITYTALTSADLAQLKTNAKIYADELSRYTAAFAGLVNCSAINLAKTVLVGGSNVGGAAWSGDMSLWFDADLNNIPYNTGLIHHEYAHIIDYAGGATFDTMMTGSWSSYNPSGFVYGPDQSQPIQPPFPLGHPEGFMEGYGRTNLAEDWATVHAYMTADHAHFQAKEWTYSDPRLAGKVKLARDWLTSVDPGMENFYNLSNGDY